MKVNTISAKSFYIVLIFLISFFNINAQSSHKQPVFVLIHGAFHEGWCWQKVSKQLRAEGM
jgi:hypothetical protein